MIEKVFKSFMILTVIMLLLSVFFTQMFIYVGVGTAIISLCLIVYETVYYKLNN